jgi:hypothetical protein
MIRIGIVGSGRPRRNGGSMCLWVGPHQAVHGRPVERVNLLKQKAAARGRGAWAGNGPLPGAASADGADKIAPFDGFVIATPADNN